MVGGDKVEVAIDEDRKMVVAVAAIELEVLSFRLSW